MYRATEEAAHKVRLEKRITLLRFTRLSKPK